MKLVGWWLLLFFVAFWIGLALAYAPGCAPTYDPLRAAAVRVYEPGAPIPWRYRTLGPVTETTCGSVLDAATEGAARAALRGRVAALHGHAVVGVLCRDAGFDCVRGLTCSGVALQWLPGQ